MIAAKWLLPLSSFLLPFAVPHTRKKKKNGGGGGVGGVGGWVGKEGGTLLLFPLDCEWGGEGRWMGSTAFFSLYLSHRLTGGEGRALVFTPFYYR